MYIGKPIFNGHTDIEQLSIIFDKLGSPDMNGWQSAQNYPNFLCFENMQPKDLNTLIPNAPPDALDLIKSMIKLDPQKRIKIKDAINHQYFH